MIYYIRLLLILALLAGLSGCGSITPVIHEGNSLQIYKNIFGENPPDDVEVIHSLYVTYSPSFRIGVITTPDWEIELIATEDWIAEKAKKLLLRETGNDDAFIMSQIKTRIEKRGREWYAPKDIREYECYYLYPTSIPYIHMLVDKTPVSDGRYCVFLSKH